jgi:hypothetical protein
VCVCVVHFDLTIRYRWISAGSISFNPHVYSSPFSMYVSALLSTCSTSQIENRSRVHFNKVFYYLPYTRGLEPVSRGHIWKLYNLQVTKITHYLSGFIYIYITRFLDAQPENQTTITDMELFQKKVQDP